MLYVYNRTENPIYLNAYKAIEIEQPTSAHYDADMKRMLAQVEKVKSARVTGRFYFPESIDGETFTVSLTDGEAKELAERKDWQALTTGPRAALVVVGASNPYGKSAAPKALNNDMRRFEPYGLGGDAAAQHYQLNRAA